MCNLEVAQVFLLKWLRHFNIQTYNRIYITCKELCLSNEIESTHSILKLLYPLLKMGFVEYAGDEKYQISPSVIISYPKKSIAVGVNLTDPQKKKLNEISYTEDIFGNIRFQLKGLKLENICSEIGCKYQISDNINLLTYFPKIKDVVTNFEGRNISSGNIQFFDAFNHKWINKEKDIGVFRVSSDGNVYYLKIKDKILKIPSNEQNPEGRLLAECFQVSNERDKFFLYDKRTKILIVNNLNLPILVERILRLSSLYNEEAVKVKSDFKVCFPNIQLSIIKQLNRIFDTKTKIING